ncbi:MAG: S1/P1 nuclease [Bacteriovoracaceae bacterium]|nr:S1/P1 nuclease [Bacteriovoracaceae bacterium]
MKNIILITLSLWSLGAWAWGNIGHRVVAQIAESRLTPKTLAKVYQLTGKETLADIANWPDWIKSDENWPQASIWHYVSIPDGQTYNDIPHSAKGDIIQAIEKFSKEVGDTTLSKEKRWEALAFLVHLVGDIHQPLHAGKSDDQGGNLLKMTWFEHNSNLHEVWDEKVIEMEKLSYTDYVAFIDKKDRSRETVWSQAPLMVWLEESIAMRSFVYDSLPVVPVGDPMPKAWEYKYYYKVSKRLNERLLMAGVRLAALLEEKL